VSVEEQARLYRATAEIWFGRFLLPFAFIILLIITVVNATGSSPALGGLALMILSVAAVFEYLLPMLRTWIRTDERVIEGQLGSRRMRIYWTEVVAAWLLDRGQRRFLCLGTRQGTIVIPMRFLPVDSIWKEVRGRVPPAALEPDAIQRLPDYRSWMNTRDALLRQDFTPRRVVDHWIVQMAGWTGIAFWISTSLEAWSRDAWLFLLALVIPGLLSLLFISQWGITEIDPECVRRRTLFGVWEIRWDDLRWLEQDITGTILVLGGEDRQMVISGPVLWAGPDRADMLAMIQAQAESRNLPLRRSFWAFFKFSQRTRIKRK
jgi:hypothetical protein